MSVRAIRLNRGFAGGGLLRWLLRWFSIEMFSYIILNIVLNGFESIDYRSLGWRIVLKELIEFIIDVVDCVHIY